MEVFSPSQSEQQTARMRQYYRMQSRIYDATRWSFLFGRKSLLDRLPFPWEFKGSFVEVGCGTGVNLKNLAKNYPFSRSLGFDVSPDMIKLSKQRVKPFGKRVELSEAPYGQGSPAKDRPDLILFSYALTMINPQWEMLIRTAFEDLKPGGHIAVVDFHDSSCPSFKSHMAGHHVRMDAHLLPVLESMFEPGFSRISNAYGGLWRFVQFVGRK